MLVVGGGLGGYGVAVEPSDLEVSRVTLSLPGLPRAFDGLRVAHLTDLHVNRIVPQARARAAVAAAMAAAPDLIVLTGDYVTGVSDDETALVADALASISAPLGVFAVLGNHDHSYGARRVTAALESAGVRVLANENVPLERHGERLYLAGVDDVRRSRPDLARALRDVPGDGRVLLLVHEPDYADTVARDGRVLLQLSGHSHGGQVVLPWGALYLPPLGRKYPSGLYEVGGLRLYTSRGIGTGQVPVRFNCRPELPIIELRATD